jgi:hypothetical protein
MRLLVAGLLALLLLPVAAARDGVTLYPDASGSFSEAPSGGYEVPLGHTPAYAVGAPPVSGENTAYWSMELTQDASIVPIHSRVWIQVINPTVLPPVAAPDAEYCPLEVSIGVSGVGYYFYCISSETTTTLTGGTYLLDLAWREGLAPLEAKAGDTLWMDVWNMGSSTGAKPTLFVVQGDAANPTSFILDGFNEPAPTLAVNVTDAPQPVDAPAGGTSSSQSSTSASKPSSAGAPSSATATSSRASVTADASSETASATLPDTTKGTPAPGFAVVVLALLALAFRRR